MKRILTFCTGLLLAFPSVEVFAQTRPESTNYQIPADVVPSGGGEGARSTNYILNDTIGEANIGPSESDLYALDAGYRQTVADSFLSLSCPSTTDLGTVSFRGQANGEMDCTVTTDNEAGYSLSWRSGVPTSNLVGHWKLDESVAGTFVDSSGNGNDGIGAGGSGGNNTPQPSTDVYSPHHSVRSVDFDGTDDTIIMSSDIANLRSVSLWFNADSSTGFRRLFQWGSNGYSAYLSNGTYDLRIIYNNNDLATGQTITPNIWNHFATTFDGETLRVFLNGIEIYTDSENAHDAAKTFYIGSTISGQSWNGQLDDVHIYDTALSLAEIQQLASKKPVIDMAASGSTVNSIPAYNFPSTGGLVGHWRMEETAGGDSVLDWSGENNDGTPAGATGANNKPQPSTDVPTGVNHATSRSMDFDGTDDYVDITDTIDLDLSDGEFSIALWVKADALPGSGDFAWFIDKSTDNDDLDYLLGIDESGDNNELRFATRALSNDIEDTTAFPTNEWVHVVAIQSDTHVRLYKNGSQVASAAIAGSATTNNTSLKIGTRTLDSSQSFDGHIDDVRIYNRALSAEEIKALYGTPQAWSVGANSIAWGARLTSGSDDTDVKWGTDSSSETWLHVGDGDYPVVSRASRTDVDGSTQTFDFRAEVGSTAILPSGTYTRTVTMTAAAL